MPVDVEAKKIVLWAESGDRADPGTLNVDETEGWDDQYEQRGSQRFPERTLTNQLFREFSGGLVELFDGLPRWVDDWDYPAMSFVAGSNGRVYLSLVATGPTVDNVTDPTGDDQRRVWRPY